MMKCNLCGSPLASDTFASLLEHGAVCGGIIAFWKEGELYRTRARFWLERRADQGRLAMKRHRSKLALEALNAQN